MLGSPVDCALHGRPRQPHIPQFFLVDPATPSATSNMSENAVCVSTDCDVSFEAAPWN